MRILQLPLVLRVAYWEERLVAHTHTHTNTASAISLVKHWYSSVQSEPTRAGVLDWKPGHGTFYVLPSRSRMHSPSPGISAAWWLLWPNSYTVQFSSWGLKIPASPLEALTSLCHCVDKPELVCRRMRPRGAGTSCSNSGALDQEAPSHPGRWPQLCEWAQPDQRHNHSAKPSLNGQSTESQTK